MTPNRPIGQQPMDLRDPTTVAVEVTAIKGQLALLGQQVSTSLSNLTSQMSAMQGDLREVERVMNSVATQQHEIQTHSSGLERLGKSIEDYVRDQAQWRRDHELDNRQVADRVTLWRGVVVGVIALAAILAGAVTYIVQSGFDTAARDRSRLEAEHGRDQKDNDARLDALEAK